MTKPLSPAAQAVLREFTHAACGSTYQVRKGIAAALRAAADQVVPAASFRNRATWSPLASKIRSELLAIAAELEWADG